MGGVFIQLGTRFSNAALEEAFETALRLAHVSQYAVLYDGGEYQAPAQ